MLFNLTYENLSYKILKLFFHDISKEWYGLEILDAMNGSIKKGSVYITLKKIEKAGLISSRQLSKPERITTQGPLPKVYKLTTKGIIATEQLIQLVETLNS